jgi:hypothetical protein
MNKDIYLVYFRPCFELYLFPTETDRPLESLPNIEFNIDNSKCFDYRAWFKLFELIHFLYFFCYLKITPGLSANMK